MEFIEGRTLQSYCAEKSMDPLRAASLGRQIAEGLAEDDAVELLDDLPHPVVEEVLERLPDSEDLRERLEFEEDTAGEAMTTKFVAVIDHWNVRMATRAVRKMAAEIESFYEVYVVNEDRQLVGRLQLRDLLLNKKKTRIRDIMRDVEVYVGPDEDQEDVLELARTYNVQNIPVVDDEMHVIGRITVEELHEIVRDEAPWIPVYVVRTFELWHPYVAGYQPNPVVPQRVKPSISKARCAGSTSPDSSA